MCTQRFWKWKAESWSIWGHVRYGFSVWHVIFDRYAEADWVNTHDLCIKELDVLAYNVTIKHHWGKIWADINQHMKVSNILVFLCDHRATQKGNLSRHITSAHGVLDVSLVNMIFVEKEKWSWEVHTGGNQSKKGNMIPVKSVINL